MKVYRTDEIRNVVLLGHGGSGKTSLAEAMLYVSGAVSRMGKISESNTTSDFDKEEQKREFSIHTTLYPIEWEKAKINILDTPGHQDFSEDTYRTLMAADSAVMVIDGSKGVEAQTRKLFKVCVMRHIPILHLSTKWTETQTIPLIFWMRSKRNWELRPALLTGLLVPEKIPRRL